MKRSVDNLHVLVFGAGLRAEGQREDVRDVGVVHRLAHKLDLTAALSSFELHLRRLRHLVDLVDDLLIDRRCDLRSVGPVDLVAVIFLRIMRGRDHHAGDGSHPADRVAQFRRRTEIVEDEHMQAVGAEYVRCDLGELLGVVAAVIGNADADVVAGRLFKNIVGQPLGRHADSIFVHPVGSDSHDASESSGAELQILVESILEPGRVVVPQFQNLHLCLGIKIPLQPLPGVLIVVLCHNLCVK